LRGDQESGLGVGERPVADEGRENISDERGDDADCDETDVEENPLGAGVAGKEMG